MSADQTKEFLKGNWITVANLVLLVTLIVQQAKWQESVDNRIEILEEHRNDKVLHMPFEKKIEVFVPRVELEGRLNTLQYSLDNIDRKLDKIK